MCTQRFNLRPRLVVIVVAGLSLTASALDLSPTASPSVPGLSPHGSDKSSAAAPLNNRSTSNQQAYAFAKTYQTMTLFIAGLLTVFLFLGFCVHYVTVRACYSIVPTEPNRSDGEGQENEQHAERGGAEGLEPWIVRSLPVVRYTAQKKQQEEENGDTMLMQECAVCLSELEEGEETKVLPVCGHCFHKACIDMWLFSHTTCPICRLSLLKQLKVNTTSLQISTSQQSSLNDLLPRRSLPTSHSLPRGPHTAVHLGATMALEPFDPSSASTSSGQHAVVVNPYDDVVDDEARNSSAALFAHTPPST